jgi:hypothetical protein
MAIARNASTETSRKDAVVTSDDGTKATGKLSVVGTDQVTVAFPMDGSEPTGSRFIGDVTLVSLANSETEFEAEILSTSLMGYVEVCQLRVVKHVAGPPLGQRAERRSSARHRPPRPMPVTVEAITDNLRPGHSEPSVTGRIGDLSTGGCGVEMTKADYRALGSITKATVSFSVPTNDRPLRLQVDRRNTRSGGVNMILMGLSWASIPSNSEGRKAVSEYLSSF